MFSKVLILAFAVATANCVAQLGYGAVGGIPVYRSSALSGGLYSANGYGYGANLGRVAGIGALRTSGAIIGGGALGYGTGALVSGYGSGIGLAAPAYKSLAVAAPAVASYGISAPAIAGYGVAARGLSVHQAGPVNAAIQTLSRTVDYRPVPYSGEPATVQDIDVPPQESPLRINFQSKSSPLQVTQQHIPAEPGQVQVTQSEDEPQTAIHNVVRPVVQQVNEVVQPFRSLTQTVEPVIEQTHTNIAQGEGIRLTGLQSGVIGGTGVLAASGLGVAAPAIASYGVARPAAIGLGLGAYKTAGLGLASGLTSGLYGARVGGLYGSGLYGSGVYGSGLSGLYGGGYRTVGGYGLGSGLGLSGYGLGSSYGYGSGLALNGLSGLSSYGTAAKVVRAY